MAMRYPGGLIATSPVNAAYPSGVWTQSQTIPYASQNVWQQDQYWRNTTLLLHGDGTNGAQNNTFLDSSSNNFTITRNGNTTQGAFTPYQQNGYWSNNFGGSTNYYLTIPSGQTPLNLSTGDFTVECWVNLTDISQYALVLTVGASAWQLGYEPSRKLFVYNGGNIMTSSTAITIGTWNHFAWTRSGTTMYLYLNGVQVATASNSSSVDLNGAYIAAYAGGTSSYPFYGSISNLRIVKGTAVYTSAFTPSTAPLTAISGTSLLTCQSNRFVDNSSNAFAITVNGTPSVQAFQPFPGPTTWSASVLGGSGYFDGSGDWLNLNNSGCYPSGTQDTTVELWWYPTSVPSVPIFLNDETTSSFGLYYESGSLKVDSRNSSTILSASYTFTAGQWYHIAYSRSGNTHNLYVNGTRIGTGSNSVSFATAGNPQNIMAQPTSSRYTPGYATDVRVVLGTALYTGSTLTVPTAPLTAVTNTQFLANFTNAGIFDNAQMNDLETVGNAQISTSVVKYGTGSMYFDGTGDWLSSPASPIWIMSGDWTIEGWIYPNSVTGVKVLIDTRNRISGGSSPVLYTNGTNLVIDTGAGAVVSAGTVSLGSSAGWQHVAATRSGNSWRLFINGTQVGSTTTNTTSFTTAYGCTVGSSYANEYYNGYIDDLRITKGVARYTANFTPPIARMPNQ